jgi:hypothetical protein
VGTDQVTLHFTLNSRPHFHNASINRERANERERERDFLVSKTACLRYHEFLLTFDPRAMAIDRYSLIFELALLHLALTAFITDN